MRQIHTRLNLFHPTMQGGPGVKSVLGRILRIMMNLLRSWPLTLLLLGLAGCTGASPASTSGGKSAAELIENGKAALARGDVDQALADFNSALEAHADLAGAREGRALAFLQMKKFDQALYDCNEALKIDGNLASAYFTRGLAEKSLGDTEKALQDFTKALDDGFQGVDVLTARGALYHSLAKGSAKPDETAQNLEKALKDFNGAVKFDPRQAGLRLQRAAIRLDMGDYENAVADCDVALDVDPALAAAHVARARGKCELGEIDQAIVDCNAAIHLDANLIEAYVIRAKAQLEKSSEMRTLAEVAECQQAVDDCQTAIGLAKNIKGDLESMKHAKTMRGLAHELRGSVYQSLQAAQKALAEYEQALALDPYLVSALLRRAVTRSAENDFAGALNDCRTAIGIDSTRPEAYSTRGRVFAMQAAERLARDSSAAAAHDSEFAKAIEDFTQAVSLDRKCANGYNGRALVYSAMAAFELEKAKKLIDPKENAACLERVYELRQKCIADATAAIDANRHLAVAYFTRGLAYANQHVTGKALVDFNTAIREDSKLVKAYYNRGVLFDQQYEIRTRLNDSAKAGEFLNAAILDFEEACKLKPSSALTYFRLCQVYQQKGDPILSNKYYMQWQEKEKSARARQELDLDAPAFAVKRKLVPELQPDGDLQPLDKAKRDLEDKLDATAEK